MNLELSIGQIVLDGFEHADAFGLEGRLRFHLEQLILERGAPEFSHERRSLSLFEELEPGRGSDQLAQQLAQSVYSALQGGVR
jgi:hypothetical protein